MRRSAAAVVSVAWGVALGGTFACLLPYLLGEWHFHPSNVVEPSAEDFEQMARIAETDSYECRDPILVIVGKAKRAGSHPLRAFVCPRGSPAIEMIAEAETSVREPNGDPVRRSSS